MGNVKEKAGRGQTTIEISLSMMEKIDEYVTRRAAHKKVVMSRLVEWFAQQPDSVKSAIMGWSDADAVEGHAQALERLLAMVRGFDPNDFDGFVIQPRQGAPAASAGGLGGQSQERPQGEHERAAGRTHPLASAPKRKS